MTTSELHPASLSVFISSTIYDLKDLGSSIGYVLRSQGVRVSALEATEFEIHEDRSTVDECFDRIRVSDFYVYIIGGRKGSGLEDGLSVTRHCLAYVSPKSLGSGGKQSPC